MNNRLERPERNRWGWLAYVFVLLIVSGSIFSEESTEKTEEPINTNHLSTVADLEKALVGRWRAKAHRTDKPGSEYQDISPNYYLYKTYFNGRFFFNMYDQLGRIYVSYGGSYKVVDQNTVHEVIDFYSPFKATQIQTGSNGQVTLLSGLSMVGATMDFNVEIEGDQLKLLGQITPNKEKLENPEYYSEIKLDHIYIREDKEVPIPAIYPD